MVYHRILNIFPCVKQQDLVIYPFYMWYPISTKPNLLLYVSPNPLPLGDQRSVLYVYDSVSVSEVINDSFIKSVIC